jgi:hypothetical protein
MSRSNHLVSVAEFRNALEAHSTRILLEANGIPAVVTGDAISEMGLEPICVFVHRENVELAHRVIQEIPAAADVLIPEWICKCGEQVDAGFNVCWSCKEPIESSREWTSEDG